MRKTPLAPLLMGLCFCSFNYASTDIDDLTIKFSGFASVVTGATTDSDDSMVVESSGLNQTIYTQDAEFEPESTAGLQANAALENGLSVVFQFVARGVEEWGVETEWAYIGYEISESSRINTGRLRLPLYMYSDFLEVGYAYPWIRPPTTVYNGAPSSFDGITYLYNRYLGDWELNTQLTSDFNTVHGANATLVYDWLSFRFTYLESKISAGPPVIVNAAWDLYELGLLPEIDDIDEILVRNEKVEFYGLGVKFEYGNYFVLTEYTEAHFQQGWIPDSENYYISAGMSFGDFLVHLTYGENESKSEYENLGLPPVATEEVPAIIAAGVSPADFGTYFPAANITKGFFDDQASKYTNITLGLRYDFHPSAALKFEVTYHEDDLYDPNAVVAVSPSELDPDGYYTDTPDKFTGQDDSLGKGDATLFNIGIDVVF